VGIPGGKIEVYESEMNIKREIREEINIEIENSYHQINYDYGIFK
jgi:8-oxo-dGTP pyrophosphatase MutT (NUDIX family)